ncbi:(deoxy)nucleoside triphosphate pyrophosphohydrolase [Lacihabitans lacunae]|uniref:8-oxo-dGTP diphosphatase n=1 Tax=Lacihabitans lacunae TaxID=1028214 RepID=A0ABV7Z052_9BACT
MIEVVCAIIKINGKILVTQRSEKMSLPLKWEFPGGKIESEETEVDCIRRELKEELNIDVDVQERLDPVVYSYPDFKIKLIPYVVKYISGNIILNEHAQYKLLNISELLILDWAEADIPIVNQIKTI